MSTREDHLKKKQESFAQPANMGFSVATVILSLSSALFIPNAFAEEINCADGASEEAYETNCSCVCWGEAMHSAGDGNTYPPGVLQNCEIFCTCSNTKTSAPEENV
jgi:hypothetical protein